MIKQGIHDHCLQIHDLAIRAMQSHTYWINTQPEAPLDELAYKQYYSFFSAANYAHLAVMVLSLDCLYAENNKYLINKLASEKYLTDDELSRFLSRLKRLKIAAKPIVVLRNNVFGHLTDLNCRFNACEKHPPSTTDLDALCRDTLVFVGDICDVINGGTEKFCPDSLKHFDTISVERLFKDLRNAI